MPNQNNNEEWNQNIVNSQDMVCFSSGDASYCIPKRLVSFIEKKAEQRGKREGLEEVNRWSLNQNSWRRSDEVIAGGNHQICNAIKK